MKETMAEAAESPALVIPRFIVGLGNPGSKYAGTRHNIGFEVIDRLAQSWSVNLSENRKFQGIYGEQPGLRGEKIRLLKPTTYMNRSGQAVRAAMDWFKLPPNDLLVVYDDMDLPLGRLRLRLSGSAGGHNGMKSIIAHVGTSDFPRLRIGIGEPRSTAVDGDSETVAHVLGQFSRSEAKLLPQVLELAQDCIDLSLRQGVEKAMSLYNSRTVTAE